QEKRRCVPRAEFNRAPGGREGARVVARALAKLGDQFVTGRGPGSEPDSLFSVCTRNVVPAGREGKAREGNRDLIGWCAHRFRLQAGGLLLRTEHLVVVSVADVVRKRCAHARVVATEG